MADRVEGDPPLGFGRTHDLGGKMRVRPPRRLGGETGPPAPAPPPPAPPPPPPRRKAPARSNSPKSRHKVMAETPSIPAVSAA